MPNAPNHWTRVGDRATWLALGDDDGWEGGMVRSVERIIGHRPKVGCGDELYVYYCGVHGPHSGPRFRKVERKHPVQIGLVTLRRDGFVSLDAGPLGGSVTTRAFPLPEGRLHLNADAVGGEVRVALLDASGGVLSESSPLGGDHCDAPVAFSGPAAKPGTPVRLKIVARQAKLYSYWFAA